MATRKITRKVIIPVKPIVKKEVLEKVEEVKVEVQPIRSESRGRGPEEVEDAKVEEGTNTKTVRAKKECAFCHSKTNPSYTDLGSLRRFLTDRAKIVSRERSGVCAKHQRQVSKNIKYARHLSLLPFVPKV